MSDPIEILDFWLGEVGPDGWYAGGEALDGECLLRFGDIWQAARDGGLDHWVEGTVGTLAYLILCDQLSRNMHRGSADSFATDGLALAAAKRAVAMGWDMNAPEPERQFFYMPFEHSEDPQDQQRSLALNQQLDASTYHWAKEHAEIIQRFGRFPHRNKVLARASTEQEQAFLDKGGFAG